MGSTTDTSSYTANSVLLTNALSQGQVGGGDLSATLRVDKDDFALYNINVQNTVGALIIIVCAIGAALTLDL